MSWLSQYLIIYHLNFIFLITFYILYNLFKIKLNYIYKMLNVVNDMLEAGN